MSRELIVFVDGESKYSHEVFTALNQEKVSIAMIVGDSAEKYSNYNGKAMICGCSRPEESDELIQLIKEKANCIGLNAGINYKLDKELINRLPILNLHPSPLPRNRGSHHSFWSIMADEEHGATIHWMNQSLDSGPILEVMKYENDEVSISSDILKKSEKLCILLLRKNIKDILSANVLPIGNEQIEENSSIHYKKEIKKASTINYNQKVDSSYLLKLCRATCAKNNGFYNKEKSGRIFKVIVSTVVVEGGV